MSVTKPTPEDTNLAMRVFLRTYGAKRHDTGPGTRPSFARSGLAASECQHRGRRGPRPLHRRRLQAGNRAGDQPERRQDPTHELRPQHKGRRH